MRSFSLAGVTPSVFTKHECTSAAVVQGYPYRHHGPHLNGEGLSHSRDRPCRLCRRDTDPTGQSRTVVTVKRSETIPPVRFVLGCSAHLPCTPFQDGASSPTSSPRGSEAQCSSGHPQLSHETKRIRFDIDMVKGRRCSKSCAMATLPARKDLSDNNAHGDDGHGALQDDDALAELRRCLEDGGGGPDVTMGNLRS